MKIVVVFLSTIFFCHCVVNIGDTETSITKEDFIKPDSIQFNYSSQSLNKVEMMNTTLKKAIEKYGEPISSYNFIIDQALKTFRIELYNIYSKDEYMKRKIKMKEVTWEVDSLYRFTIRCKVLCDSTSVAMDSCSYHKNTCF